ncbi:MAG: hypothetical protein ABI912_06235 [Actinomycetota bacterium]
MKTPPTKLSIVRGRLRERREAHQRRLRLERELAVYDSPSDRHELDAILSRHTAEQTLEIDRILARQAVRRQHDHTRPPR